MTKTVPPTATEIDRLLIDMHRDFVADADSPLGYDPTEEEIEAAYQEYLRSAGAPTATEKLTVGKLVAAGRGDLTPQAFVRRLNISVGDLKNLESCEVEIDVARPSDAAKAAAAKIAVPMFTILRVLNDAIAKQASAGSPIMLAARTSPTEKE